MYSLSSQRCATHDRLTIMPQRDTWRTSVAYPPILRRVSTPQCVLSAEASHVAFETERLLGPANNELYSELLLLAFGVTLFQSRRDNGALQCKRIGDFRSKRAPGRNLRFQKATKSICLNKEMYIGLGKCGPEFRYDGAQVRS